MKYGQTAYNRIVNASPPSAARQPQKRHIPPKRYATFTIKILWINNR